MFERTDLAFDAGIFANRSKKASVNRFIDGDLVRFPDGPPQQVGGWLAKTVTGSALSGLARAMEAWRPLDLGARYAAIGTHTKLFLLANTSISDITPAGLSAGVADTGFGKGYGMAAYGVGPYGSGTKASSSVLVDGATWSFDLFGQILVACYRQNQTIYTYDPTLDSVAQPIDGAPSARCIAVSEERHLFGFGCNGEDTLVLWSDRENYTKWDLTEPGTRAGSYDMNNTTPYQCGHSCRGMMMAWTLTECFAFTPLGNAAVYSRDRLATGCGVAGPQAVAIVTSEDSEIALWMGEAAFFIFDGLARELPCELRDYVFNDINLTQRVKFNARVNAEKGEVWFHYCSSASAECNRAIIYSYRGGWWSKASIGRLIGVDKGIFDYPLSIDAAGTIYEHDRGATANGVTMPSFVLTHPLQFSNARQHMEVDAFWPDLEETSSGCTVTFFTKDFPGDPVGTVGPFTFDTTTEKQDLNIDARFIQIKIAGNGGYWELGLPAASVQDGGER